MSRILLTFLLILTVLLTVNCQKRKDDSLDKAIFNYILLCPGGNQKACEATCESQYGANVTTDNFSEVSRCISNCSSNCNLQSIYLLIESNK